MLQTMSFNHCPVDINLGGYFINLALVLQLRPYSAVDLPQFSNELTLDFPSLITKFKKSKRVLGCWKRTWMGLKSSPEIAARPYYFSKELIRGKEDDPTNPFYWDKVVINAIGQEDFNPSLPWLFKYDSTRNRIAGDVRAYVDNLRCVGWSLEHAWKLARQVASTLQHLGIQDAPRKRRIDAGPWARTLYHANKTTVSVMVMQKKWDKGRIYLATLVDLAGWDLDS